METTVVFWVAKLKDSECILLARLSKIIAICYDFRSMDDGNKFNIGELIRKPVVIIIGVVLVLIILGMLLFGGSEETNPRAVELKNLINRHSATIDVADKYGKDVRSANLRSNLSQVNIILTANKSEIEEYYKEAFKSVKNVKATFAEKPAKELTEKLDEGIVDNNLDKVLQKVVNDELVEINSEMQEVRKNNSDKKKLIVLMDRLRLNVNDLLGKVNQPL